MRGGRTARLGPSGLDRHEDIGCTDRRPRSLQTRGCAPTVRSRRQLLEDRFEYRVAQHPADEHDPLADPDQR